MKVLVLATSYSIPRESVASHFIPPCVRIVVVGSSVKYS